MSDRELTTAEAAERLNVAERTIRLWCQQGRFPNARPEETPFGAYWKIPEIDLKDFQPPKMGRPRKEPATTPAKKSRKKREAK
jgi:excisionase family DNA binding protein